MVKMETSLKTVLIVKSIKKTLKAGNLRDILAGIQQADAMAEPGCSCLRNTPQKICNM